MHSYDSTFHRFLQQKIDEEIDRQRLLVTNAPLPHEQYVYRVGRIDGLRLTLQFCQEVEQNMQGIK